MVQTISPKLIILHARNLIVLKILIGSNYSFNISWYNLSGRTSRVAFKMAEEFSEICGLPQELIEDLRKMLDALSSGHDLDPDKFQVRPLK